MISTFQESSWDTAEMARPVGHSQMIAASSLRAFLLASSSVHPWFEAVRNCRLRLSAPVDVSGADVSLWLSATAPSSSGGRRSIKSNESKRAAGTCKLDFDPKLRVTLASP